MLGFNRVPSKYRKGRGTRDQIATIHWIMEKAREFQKNIYFCFIDYAKAFDCVDHNKLWKILKDSVKKPSCGRELGGLGGAPSVSDYEAVF